MVPAPRYVKSIKVTNVSGAPAKVIARYHHENLNDSNRKSATHVIDAPMEHNTAHVFEEKDKNMGTWTAVVPIQEIETVINGNTTLISLSSLVQGVVGILHLRLTSTDGKYEVEPTS